MAKQMDAKDENVKEACWIKYIDLALYNYNIAVYSATCKCHLNFLRAQRI